MSAGVCAVCLGAAPAFTGALGEKPEDRVVSVSIHDVHGNRRHITICNGCTRTIVGVWARLGRGRTKRLRQKLQPAPDTILECAACGRFYGGDEDHTCEG